jgi:hypothetical protein
VILSENQAGIKVKKGKNNVGLSETDMLTSMGIFLSKIPACCCHLFAAYKAYSVYIAANCRGLAMTHKLHSYDTIT